MTKAEKTRHFIIEKSAPIFNVKGVAGTAMSDIMEATGLAKGSLYVHFESKEELAGCTVDHVFKNLSDKSAAAVSKHKTSKAKLFAFIDFFSDPIHAHIKGGCPMLNFGMESDDTDPVIRKKVSAMIEHTQQTIAALAEQGIKNGEFSKGWKAKEFAIRAFAMIEGGIFITRVSGDHEKMKTIVRMLKKEIEEQVT